MAAPDPITVAGEIYLDQILSGFAAWPAPGEEAFATGYAREVGGGAAITAAGMVRLGRAVRLAGMIGGEEWVPERLRRLGIDTDFLHRYPAEPTGTTVAVSMPEDRTFFSYRGANQGLATVLSSLPAGRHLHLGCAPPHELLPALRRRFATISLDAGFVRDWLADPATREVLRLVDWFLPNELEGAFLSGSSEPATILNWFAGQGIRVVLKLGPRGSAVLHEGTILAVPSISVTPVDTTGAGDCFDAGFLDAWLAGEPPERCLRAGNVCGALSTRSAGGIAAFPTREELLAWL